MRLYPGKVDTIATEIITTLTQANDIEVSDGNEAQLDAASVLKEYIRVEGAHGAREGYPGDPRPSVFAPRPHEAPARGAEGIRPR